MMHPAAEITWWIRAMGLIWCTMDPQIHHVTRIHHVDFRDAEFADGLVSGWPRGLGGQREDRDCAGDQGECADGMRPGRVGKDQQPRPRHQRDHGNRAPQPPSPRPVTPGVSCPASASAVPSAARFRATPPPPFLTSHAACDVATPRTGTVALIAAGDTRGSTEMSEGVSTLCPSIRRMHGRRHGNRL